MSVSQKAGYSITYFCSILIVLHYIILYYIITLHYIKLHTVCKSICFCLYTQTVYMCFLCRSMQYPKGIIVGKKVQNFKMTVAVIGTFCHFK